MSMQTILMNTERFVGTFCQNISENPKCVISEQFIKPPSAVQHTTPFA